MDMEAVNCDFSYFTLKDTLVKDAKLVAAKCENSDWKRYCEVGGNV